MKKFLPIVAAFAMIAALSTEGTGWTATPHRPRPRSVYCHYRSSDGRPKFSDIDVIRTIRCATNKFGVDTSHALEIADRESGYSWWARNPLSGTCGIFQHIPRYWPGRRAAFLRVHPYWHLLPSCYNARSNVVVSAWMMRHGFGPWGG